MSNTYKIKTISDLLSVPEDRRTDCLMALEHGLKLADRISVATKAALPSWLHWFCEPRFGLFTWIDDDKDEATVRLNGKVILHQEHRK